MINRYELLVIPKFHLKAILQVEIFLLDCFFEYDDINLEWFDDVPEVIGDDRDKKPHKKDNHDAWMVVKMPDTIAPSIKSKYLEQR
jgi:hypothetical protein